MNGYVAEKRYCVAGKIVETFLDPWYNPLAKNGMTWNINVKQEIANTLYERLPDSALERFAHAYRNPTQQDLAEALAEVEAECCRNVNPELAKFFHGSHASLDEIAAAEIEANTTWGRGGGTLNLPCLIAFIMMIEQMGRSGAFLTNKLVHDEQGAYEDTYKAAFLHCKERSDFWATIPGSELGHGSVLTVDSFETQRSVDQPLIQAADVLSGAINSLCIKLIGGQELTAHDLEVSRYVLTPMLFRKFKIAFPVCSDRMLRHIGEAVRKSFPEFGEEAEDPPYKKSESRGLPLMPPTPMQPKAVLPTDRPKFEINLPLYGIVCGEEDRLIAISYVVPSNVIAEDEPVIPLFTTEELASEFLREAQPLWDEPHRVRCFSFPELRGLLEQLNDMAKFADKILLNSKGVIETLNVVEGLSQVTERILKAAQTGALDVLTEHHSVDGVNIVSVLMSSGEYGAMRDGGGEVFRASTRQEAVQAAVTAISEKSIPKN